MTMRYAIDIKELTIEDLRKNKEKHSYIKLTGFPKADISIEDKLENESNGIENGEQILDVQTINVLLMVYDALTREDLKEKFKRMLNNQIFTLAKFCWSKVSYKV